MLLILNVGAYGLDETYNALRLSEALDDQPPTPCLRLLLATVVTSPAAEPVGTPAGSPETTS